MIFRKLNAKKALDKINSIRYERGVDVAVRLREIKNGNMPDFEKVCHAMALCRIASEVSLGQRHYDVQILGALALVDGKIAQMKTGEGKTLMCSAAVAANFVLGRKTHVATANEYLAQRDAQALAPLYGKMGITSSFNISHMSGKAEAYTAEVMYSTAQELGFDYLRDNLVKDIKDKIQLHHDCAIIDEADFILIDEARTPLIITGEGSGYERSFYDQMRRTALKMKRIAKEPSVHHVSIGDFWVDEKTKSVQLSESGYEHIERELDIAIYSRENLWMIDEILNALRAEYLYIRDRQYVVENAAVVIIDENTGRLSHGRSWSDGLHQAIEAKEQLQINRLSETVGTISVQNYFRNYKSICGMTGTAVRAKDEFEEIYNCLVEVIPTHKTMIRVDHSDRVFVRAAEKYRQLIEDVERRHKLGQPILLGTSSVSESELVSNLLKEKNIVHSVLNAKNNNLEAKIIAQAGSLGSVTVSTSMAGRGTDIILGGNKEELQKIMNQQSALRAQKRDLITALIEDAEHQGQGTTDIGASTENYLSELSLDFLYSLSKEQLARQLRELDAVELDTTTNRDAVIAAGGLCIIGCTRHESRRIDDQLMGRAGRQGDVGESQFYLSFEDNLLRVFAENAVYKMLSESSNTLSLNSKFVARSIEKAQATIEGMYFDNRKNVFQYDSVLDEARRYFFQIRDRFITDSSYIKDIFERNLLETPEISEDLIDSVEVSGALEDYMVERFHIKKANAVKLRAILSVDNYEELPEQLMRYYESLTPEFWSWFNRQCLDVLDESWVEYLNVTEEIRTNSNLRAFAHKNPLYEYKRECYTLFESMISSFSRNSLNLLLEKTEI